MHVLFPFSVLAVLNFQKRSIKAFAQKYTAGEVKVTTEHSAE